MAKKKKETEEIIEKQDKLEKKEVEIIKKETSNKQVWKPVAKKEKEGNKNFFSKALDFLGL